MTKYRKITNISPIRYRYIEKDDIYSADTIPIPIYRYRRYIDDIFDIPTHL